MNLKFDFIIIGSGIAGLSFALEVAQTGRVAIITKKNRSESNTNYAQGGIAAVLAPTDSVEKHVQDTLTAGAGLCDEQVVRSIIGASKEAIEKLLNHGVNFSKSDSGNFDLTQEGGHSERRVLHAGDFTGQEIERALIHAVSTHPNITLYEHHIAIDLVTNHKLNLELNDPKRIIGLYTYDYRKQVITAFTAPVMMLASGGAGKVYQYTSNPDIATGDGIALAYRAGCSVANLEFVQFHPTSLYHPTAKNFLLSEALRGEGGKLKSLSGEELDSLAPRDIVARAIDREMKKSGAAYVLLDMTHLDAAFLKKRFPNIDEKLLSYGYDMTSQPIPVVPAAHYMCGGVLSSTDGETNIQNLYVCGEVACTGFHGANRLASNSLLEAVVIAQNVAKKIRSTTLQHSDFELPAWNSQNTAPWDEKVLINQNWSELRKLMWNYVGIVRSNSRLNKALARINLMQKEIDEYYWKYQITEDFLELRNLVLVAGLIVKMALGRHESRGLHYNVDYPETLTLAKNSIVKL